MDACVRAAADGLMRAVRYDGFWAPMDTLKERTALQEQYRNGQSPWAVWRKTSSAAPIPAPVPAVDPAP